MMPMIRSPDANGIQVFLFDHLEIVIVRIGCFAGGFLDVLDGSITVLTPYEKGTDGKLCPRYRDLFPEAPPPGLVPSCAEAGVIGALTGVSGTFQAMEVIKLITGAGEPLVGRLLLYDGLAASFQTIRYGRKG